MEIAKKKLLIFDYDGTIADTSILHKRAFHKTLEPLKLKFDYNEIAGLKTIDAIYYCMNENGKKLSSEEIKLLVKNKQSIFSEIIKKEIQPISGVKEFLYWAYSKYNLFIASSGSKKNVYKGLKLLGLFELFNKIICADDVNLAKPHPEIFYKAIKTANISKKEALIFEDSDNGINASRKAGIDYIDIRTHPFKEILSEFKKNGI